MSFLQVMFGSVLAVLLGYASYSDRLVFIGTGVFMFVIVLWVCKSLYKLFRLDE